MSHDGNLVVQAAQPEASWIGGTTRQLYTFPANAELRAGNYQFWAGTATIARAAEYSFFPMVRIHLPVQGNGLRLCFRQPDEIVALHTGEPYRFDGARPLRAELIDGPVVAFNLIFRADVQARAQLLRLGQDVISLPPVEATRAASATKVTRILYAVAGTSIISGAAHGETQLHAGDAIMFHAARAPLASALALRSLGDSATLVVAEVAI